MFSFLSTGIVRLLLVLSVSLWMAGGCLLGCSTSAAASEQPALAIETRASCHHAAKSEAKPPKGVPSFMPGPRGTMQDCPLAVSATAVTAKTSNHFPDPGSGPTASLPVTDRAVVQISTTSLIRIPPNGGPTYLRCCVLLI